MPNKEPNKPKSQVKLRPDVSIKNSNKRKPVVQLTITGIFINIYQSVSEAAIKVNGNPPNISKCCNSRNSMKTYKGYRWRFVKDIDLEKMLKEQRIIIKET